MMPVTKWDLSYALERQTGAKVYTNGAESRNVAQNGGYAARYKATAGFQKIPENQVLLNEGKVEQNEGFFIRRPLFTTGEWSFPATGFPRPPACSLFPRRK